MTKIIDVLGARPVGGFVEIQRFPLSFAFPQVGDGALKFLEQLDRGSLPIIYGGGSDNGTLFGVLSVFDFRADFELALHSRHALATYDFRRLKLGPGKVGHPVLEPLRETDTVRKLIALFASGTRRVFVVDRENRPIGYIDLGDFVRALLREFPQLLVDRQVARIMLYGDRGLTTILAEPISTTFLAFSRWRRMVFVFVLGQLTRMLTIREVIAAMQKVGDPTRCVVSEAFPGSEEKIPADRYQLPCAHVPLDASVMAVLDQLIAHQEVLVTTRTGAVADDVKGHLSLPWLFVREILPELQTMEV